ncbi:MAG: glycerate kinase, partial [Cyanobacteria bacterium P01_G01_bin.49]
MDFVKILQNWIQNKTPLSSELEFLLQKELSNVDQCRAFNITPENGLNKIINRAQIFQETYQKVYQV